VPVVTSGERGFVVHNADALCGTPNPLAAQYSRFQVEERILLTGHSHQAWPDRAFLGQKRAWLDAAELADEKWDRAFAKADRVRLGFARLLGDEPDRIALAQNTHELVIRFLSGLPLRERPRVVTTDGEFHTIRRQLDRLAEEGLEVVKVPAHPAASVGERLVSEIDDRAAAVMVSSVFFQTGHIAGGLGEVMLACGLQGVELLVDVYHSLNVVPFRLADEGVEDAFVVGGGYKYCQLGEGNCFLRVPPGREEMRPLVTGWFSEFSALETPGAGGPVAYGLGPDRFAGSTYDPTSHYRAAEVFDCFEEWGLTSELLRQVSQRQIGLLAERFDGLDTDPTVIDRDRSMDFSQIGGFLVLQTRHAAKLCAALRDRGVSTDYREDLLRLGPAPYLSEEQLTSAAATLGEVIGEVGP
jgi:kynureninase